MEKTYRQGIGFLKLDESLCLDSEMSDEMYRELTGVPYADAVGAVMRTDAYSDALAKIREDDSIFQIPIGDDGTPEPLATMLMFGLEPKDALWHSLYDSLIEKTIGESPSIPIEGDFLYAVRCGLADLDETALLHVLRNEGRDGKWNGYASDSKYVFTKYAFTGNTGLCFENDEFLLHAYDWGETYYGGLNMANFWHKSTGAVIDWYKYIGRGTCGNSKAIGILEAGGFHEIIESCINSLLEE